MKEAALPSVIHQALTSLFREKPALGLRLFQSATDALLPAGARFSASPSPLSNARLSRRPRSNDARRWTKSGASRSTDLAIKLRARGMRTTPLARSPRSFTGGRARRNGHYEVTTLVHALYLGGVGVNALNEVAARLRELRRQRHVSAMALARRLGVAPSFLSRVARSLGPAPAQLVRRVAAELSALVEPLLVPARRFPADVHAIRRMQPDRALHLLRKRLGDRSARDMSAQTRRWAA